MNRLTKNIYRVLLMASFIAINALIISGISALLSYLNTGADKSSILQVEKAMEKVYAPKVTWGSLENPGRPMEKQTLKEIERDYLNAWHVRNIAFKKNDSYGIADFYTDSARTKLIEHIILNGKNNTWYKTTTLEHFPELDFYSEDGTLVVFTDKNVELYQETYVGDTLVYHHKERVNYQVMLLLEDGFWRIRHLKMLEVNEKEASAPIRAIDSFLSAVKNIKGINYYPQQTPWDTFGKGFSDTIITADFKIIENMGLNTIRLFIPYEDFGKAAVDPKKLERLKKTFSIAQKHNLKILLTLFDFYGDYDVNNWTITERHAESIVNALKEHPALLAWDIKNEPDLDFESRGEFQVLQWLEEMTLKIKQWDPNHPITIGWSNTDAAVHLADAVDFVSYHYYQDPEDFLKAQEELRIKVQHKPLLLQEYGYSSYDGFWAMFTGGEKNQAAYYSKMQSQLKAEEIPFVFWTLYDFKDVPAAVAGSLPWRTRKQGYFGCITSDGTKKEAFKILEQQR